MTIDGVPNGSGEVQPSSSIFMPSFSIIWRREHDALLDLEGVGDLVADGEDVGHLEAEAVDVEAQ